MKDNIKIVVIEVLNGDNEWEWWDVIRESVYDENKALSRRLAYSEHIGEEEDDTYVIENYKEYTRVSKPINLDRQ